MPPSDRECSTSLRLRRLWRTRQSALFLLPPSCWRGCVRLWALAANFPARRRHTPYAPGSPCSARFPLLLQSPAASTLALATSPFAAVGNAFCLSLCAAPFPAAAARFSSSTPPLRISDDFSESYCYPLGNPLSIQFVQKVVL